MIKKNVRMSVMLALVLLAAGMFVFLPVEKASAARMMALWTNRNAYDRDDPVRVSGSVPELIKGASVALRLMDPMNREISRGHVFPHSDGTYSFTFRAVREDSGLYSIEANYAGHFAIATFSVSTGEVDRDSR